MAEKVRDNVTGLHFRAGSAESLVDRLSEAMRSPTLWDRLRRQIQSPLEAVDAAQQHAKMYETLIAARRTTDAPTALQFKRSEPRLRIVAAE